MRRRGRDLGSTFLAAILVGCGSPILSASPTTPTVTPPASAGPSATLAPTATPAEMASGAGVPYDEALLQVLPATVADLPVVSTPELAADLGADPQLSLISTGFAAGLVTDQASGELAVAMLVRLRDGVFGDEFFRDYRDSFDAAACAPAGGLVGNAEAEIGGRRTFIASCENGARTYHVHLEDPSVLVSVTAASERLRLGERVIESLAE